MHTRRRFLGLSGSAVLSSAIAAHAAPLGFDRVSHDTSALEAALHRILGPHSAQIHLRLASQAASEHFRISGKPGNILVEASTPSAVMMGVHWYLKYVAGVSISWNGDCLNRLPRTLPAPSAPIRNAATVRHRFALNDTNDGYTGPYWQWPQWERLIDVLALHGINEVLVYMGAEAVYQRTFCNFHYSAEEMRHWFPTPAHQPWWLLENLSGWVGPSVSQHLIDDRAALAAKITSRLRELGLTPVLPGYYGMVPNGFAAKNPGAHVLPQGDWLGLKRPEWLDPTCPLFATVAQQYYRAQQQVLGPTTMFKMDPLHEGGRAGNVNLTHAATSIEAQLQKAHPGATWAILGWQANPKPQVLAGIRHKDRMLILDGQSDTFAYQNREKQWNNIPYAFGSIWNFGGRTTIGANIGVWNHRYYHQLAKPGSRLQGIAVMPEASCNNPAAFAFLTELAWRKQRPSRAQWFRQWSAYRYGSRDENSARAWNILLTTAYNESAGKWSDSHDNLFSAQPSLTVRSAATWSPKSPRYSLAAFQPAIQYLLRVHPSLRNSSAYHYDLVDVARQTLANQSRVMLPRIHAAYTAQNLPQFKQLTALWLESITQLDRIVGTNEWFLLGPWIAAARAAGNTPAERNQLEFDARSLLVEWGPPASATSGVHDYANREWNGLLDFYRQRWALYFTSLETSLQTHQPPRPIDWFSVDQDWARQTNPYPLQPREDPYTLIHQIMTHSKSMHLQTT
jgi:alpha-N-acetylglucosaminidase